MSCCKSIGAALKKIVKAIAPILAVALLAFAAYSYFVIGPAALGSVKALAWLPAGMAGLSGATAAYIALGASVVLDPSAAGDVLGGAAEAVGEVAGDVLGGLVTGITGGGSLLPLLLGGLAIWWFFLRDKSEDKPVAEPKGDKPVTEPKERTTDVRSETSLTQSEVQYGQQRRDNTPSQAV